MHLLAWILATSAVLSIAFDVDWIDDNARYPSVLDGNLRPRSPARSGGSTNSILAATTAERGSPGSIDLGYKAIDYSKPRSSSSEKKRAEILERRRGYQSSKSTGSIPQMKKQKTSSSGKSKTEDSEKGDESIVSEKKRTSHHRKTRSKSSSSDAASTPNQPGEIPLNSKGIPIDLKRLRLRPTPERSVQLKLNQWLVKTNQQNFDQGEEGPYFRDDARKSSRSTHGLDYSNQALGSE